MKSFKLVLGLALASAGLLGAACDSGIADTRDDRPIEVEKLALSFFTQDTTTACGEAAGIRVTVAMGDQELTCDALWTALVGEEYTAEEDNGVHFVADCFLLVEPGMWTVESIDVIDVSGGVLECCEATFESGIEVIEGKTSELGAELTCDRVGPGAIDIYGWLNRPPILKALEIAPSKFTGPCVPRFLIAEAEDMEGDHFSFDWEVIESPGTKYALWEHDYWAVFVGLSPGDYLLRVTVSDEHGAATALEFPLHVVMPFAQGDACIDCFCELDVEPL